MRHGVVARSLVLPLTGISTRTVNVGSQPTLSVPSNDAISLLIPVIPPRSISGCGDDSPSSVMTRWAVSPVHSSSTKTCLAWACRHEFVQASRIMCVKATPALPSGSSPFILIATPTSAKADTTASSSVEASASVPRRKSTMTDERSRSSSATDAGSVMPISR